MATPVPELVLSNTELDIVCISESECTIVPLVRELLNGGRIDNIEGIAFKDADGAIRRSPSRPRILNLDDLPYPAYDLVDIKLYMGNVGKRPSLMEDAKRRGYDPSKVSSPFIMFSSRGCPFSCTFCYRNFGRQVTRHSVDYMIKHILHVHERYSANNIAFYDETFNSDRKWMLEFCERAKRELPGMHFWIGGARVDLLDESMVKALYDAGVYEVSVGVESFDDRILQAIGKRFDAQTLRRGIELLKQYGVAPSCMGMLYGFPEDDERSLQVSQAAIIELGIPAYFQFPVPFPGTDLYAALRSSGRLQDEEQFMLDLGDRMTQDLFINLSRFDDKTLVDMVRSAEETIAKAIAPPVEPPKPLSLYRRVRNLAGRILRRATS
jgi:anaerobic magnesium-protoporphyrin IX monomethyl ester cyclase